MSAACPVCDVESFAMTPTMALAMGVALGAAFQDMHRVTELCCEKHRSLYIMAMMRADILNNTADAAPAEEGEDT